MNEDDIGRIFRAGSGRSVAALIRTFGDIDLAEDAVQDAFAVALTKWPQDGLPPEPERWILATARNRAIDRLRRESLGRALLGEMALGAGADEAEPQGPVHGEADGELGDERLRLIFTCCHPALAVEAQIALTLRLLCGLATEEVARAFLVEPQTMGQRLVRVKRKIKATSLPYRVPGTAELAERLPPVLKVVYLIYNAGAGEPPRSGDAERDSLCAEAPRLARLLTRLLPAEPEATGLLALLLLTESRRGARFDPDGKLVLLRDQDRTRWRRDLLAEGQGWVRACLRIDRPGPYQLQAAIGAVHADATTFETTDWPQIVTLYDHLLAIEPTEVIALNRAIAIGEVDGPQAALDLIEPLTLDGYYLVHATRADLLRRLGRSDEARASYLRASELAPTDAERRFLAAQATER